MTTLIWRNAEEGWIEKESAKPVDGVEVNVRRDIYFSSSQLPKNWKYHEGAFDKNGKPIYTNRRDIENDIARAGYADGTEIEYDAL